MSKQTKRWLIAGGGIALATVIVSVIAAGYTLKKRFDPYIRQQAIEYLSRRFDSEVEIGKLSVDIPRIPVMKLYWTHGKGIIAKVTGEDVVLRYKGRRDVPPMFRMARFQFETDLGGVFEPVKHISNVGIERMEIQVPPKGDRPDLKTPPSAAGPGMTEDALAGLNIIIDQVVITDSRLLILPRDRTRKPLEFALRKVVLDPVGATQPFRYRATLTNALPPGQIEANGNFGPWKTSAPGDTLLDGKYSFQKADLGVFPAIQGTLNSTGSFTGTLASIKARGEADVPDFRLRAAGNPMLLHTSFSVLVDGTNGNTILEPVHATLGTTSFTTSGAILKREATPMRSIDLDVDMPDGEMLDLLRLATKTKPFMSGRLQMTAKIRIPPLRGTIGNKLILDGQFHIRRGQFLEAAAQTQIDTLSRRGQGQPKNQSIDNVFSDMAGVFHMENQAIQFQSLTFAVPGSKVDLAGRYDIAGDALDFRGALSLDAHVSQTLTGWKHWLAKAADPFFAKHGAGTYLKIKVNGTSHDPHFGLAR